MILNIKKDKLNTIANSLKSKFSKMTIEDIETFIEYELNNLHNEGLYLKYGNIYSYYQEVLNNTHIVINDIDFNL